MFPLEETTWIRQGLTRSRLLITDRSEQGVSVSGKSCKHFASSDYLNLSTHPDLCDAFIAGINRFGVGSAASALVSGYYEPMQAFELAFADFVGAERALLFSSGTLANYGALTTLLKRQDVVIADKYCHASLLDAIQLSRAKLYRYPHQDLMAAEKLLAQHGKVALLVTESVFSMQGEPSPLSDLVKLAKHYGARCYIDDAHAAGILGENGRGGLSESGLAISDVDALAVPLGKAFGLAGAFVAGSAQLIESMLQHARAYRYSTSMPPAQAAAGLKALQLLQTAHLEREKLLVLSHHFNQKAKILGLPLLNDALHPIRCILTKENDLAEKIKRDALEKGFLISSIRPPTVPTHQSRLRLSLNAAHSKNDIDSLLELIACHFN